MDLRLASCCTKQYAFMRALLEFGHPVPRPLEPSQEARNPTINVVMKRGTEDGAGWDTSYACQSTAGAPSPVKLRETLFADVPNPSIENATKMSQDRKLRSSNKPSLRCQPLPGGVAIK